MITWKLFFFFFFYLSTILNNSNITYNNNIMSTTVQWTKLQYITKKYYITLHFQITFHFHYITSHFSKATVHYTYTYITYSHASYCCDNYSTWNGFANKMLIRGRFSVYRSVRGREGNFLFSGKYCVFCIPREKVWWSLSRSLVSCSYLDSIPVLDMPLS